MIGTKRVYAPAELTDGHRVLVDRLWPRGITRERARIDQWLKDLAPSHELRKWFQKEPEQWSEFSSRYAAELQLPLQMELIEQIRDRAADATVTLLYSVRNESQNHAVVLKNVVLSQQNVHSHPEVKATLF